MPPVGAARAYRHCLCDAEGVPKLVQGMKYHYSDMTVEVEFFNGTPLRFYVDNICPSVALLEKKPSPEQMLEIEATIEKLAKAEWRNWFPDAKR